MKKFKKGAVTGRGKPITSFVALNHLCWFSKDYKLLTVKQVIDLGKYEYIEWCMSKLGNLKFHALVKSYISKYKEKHKS